MPQLIDQVSEFNPNLDLSGLWYDWMKVFIDTRSMPLIRAWVDKFETDVLLLYARPRRTVELGDLKTFQKSMKYFSQYLLLQNPHQYHR